MSEAAGIEVSPAAAQPVDLEEMVAGLRARYPRAAHAGRIDQIEQQARSLAGMIAELPAEEEREADYEDRLVAAYDGGQFGSAPHTAGHDARVRLDDALARRNGG